MKKRRIVTALALAAVMLLQPVLPVLADEPSGSLADLEADVSLEEAADVEPAAEAEPADDAAAAKPADDAAAPELLEEAPALSPINGAQSIEGATMSGLKNGYLMENDVYGKIPTIEGKPINEWKPKLTVKLNGVTLTEGTDYTVSADTSHFAKISVTVKGINNYTGSITKACPYHYALTMHGKNRYYTAALTALTTLEATEDLPDEIVIVKGTDFPDALAANAYAGIVGAPLLLTKKDSLHQACKDFLKGNFGSILGVDIGSGSGNPFEDLKKITVIGGDLDGAVKDIKNLLPGVTVKIIAGKNRYKTAEEVCKAVIEIAKAKGESLDNVFVATGQAPWDALSASTWSYKYYIPVLLAKNGELASTAKNLAGKFRRVILLGSSSVVKDSVVPSGCLKVRLAGKNRYKTSEAIGEWFVKSYVPGSQNYIIGSLYAHGEKFPDALAGGQMAMIVTGPMVLINDKNTAPAYLKTYRPGGSYQSIAPTAYYMMIGYVNKEQWKSGYNKLIDTIYGFL